MYTFYLSVKQRITKYKCRVAGFAQNMVKIVFVRPVVIPTSIVYSWTALQTAERVGVSAGIELFFCFLKIYLAIFPKILKNYSNDIAVDLLCGSRSPPLKGRG